MCKRYRYKDATKLKSSFIILNMLMQSNFFSQVRKNILCMVNESISTFESYQYD